MSIWKGEKKSNDNDDLFLEIESFFDSITGDENSGQKF